MLIDWIICFLELRHDKYGPSQWAVSVCEELLSLIQGLVLVVQCFLYWPVVRE